MNPWKQSRFNGSVIVALFISLISTFYLMPAASAQGTVSIPGTVDNLPVHPGDTISFTYAVSVTDPKTISVTVSEISTAVQLSVRCPNGSSQTITINAPFAVETRGSRPPSPSRPVPRPPATQILLRAAATHCALALHTSIIAFLHQALANLASQESSARQRSTAGAVHNVVSPRVLCWIVLACSSGGSSSVA